MGSSLLLVRRARKSGVWNLVGRLELADQGTLFLDEVGETLL
jgi:transcriptional regulator with GAF, ATPase, and Fis domain